MRVKSTIHLLTLAFLVLCGCATTHVTRQTHDLRQQIAVVDNAYRTLQPDNTQTYNASLDSIAREMERDSPAEFQQELAVIGVKLDEPAIKLPLVQYKVVRREQALLPNGAGVPILLDFDTRQAPLYPPDGLVVSATAVYRHVGREPHLSLVSGKTRIELNGSTYPLKIDNVAPITVMNRRGRYVARAGFRNMLRPGSMRQRSGIFLTEPYDPNKEIVLMVPGLQSTPFAFVDLLKAMRADPEVSAHFQVWTFLYATGTPVLLNALELRQELEKTVRAVDPHDHDFATRHIVVVGHSMGGLIAHTLVSSSGDDVWASVFTIPPEKFQGNAQTIRQIRDALIFQRNPRVVCAIFASTPHRGSKLAESWIGRVGASLIRLPPAIQTALVELATENPHAPTPEAARFAKGFNFTSVRALSPNEPALRALAQLPVTVPFHSIIGQHNAGPTETSSDGVVPYSSSHLDGAASELIVRSGHNVCEKRDAQREVIRILRLELQRKR